MTGWAVFSDGWLTEHGVIKVKTYHTTSDERIMEMFWEIRKTMEQFEPDAVVMEDVAKQKNVVKPSTWREALHFKQGRTERKELKRQAQAFVNDKYGMTVSEDEADAICIGEYYMISKEGKA